MYITMCLDFPLKQTIGINKYGENISDFLKIKKYVSMVTARKLKYMLQVRTVGIYMKRNLYL